MRRIRTFLDKIVVDLLGCQVAVVNQILLSFKDELEIVPFEGHGGGADNLDLSALVDEDVDGMHAAYFSLQMLEFAARTDNIVEEVPDLSFEKIFAKALPVGDLGLQNKLVVVKAELG